MKDRTVSIEPIKYESTESKRVTRSHEMIPLKHLSINIPYPLYNKLVKFAQQEKCFLTDVIREGIEMRISEINRC